MNAREAVNFQCAESPLARGREGREHKSSPDPGEVLAVVNRIRRARLQDPLQALPFEGVPCEPDACIVACWTGVDVSERELMFCEKKDAVEVAVALWAGEQRWPAVPRMNEEWGMWSLPLPDCLCEIVDRFDFGELDLNDLALDKIEISEMQEVCAA